MKSRALKILAATKLLPLLLLLSLPVVAQALDQQYPTTAGTIYYFAYNGAIIIDGYIGSDTTLIIPSTITNLPVVEIWGDTFADSTSLTSVTIPYGVTSIDSGAFYGCTSLTSFTIPDSVTSLGGDVFAECSNLTSVTIGSSVTSLGAGAFYGCSSLTSVTIPDSVTSIGDDAFHGCTSLAGVTIGSGVTSIGNDAFYGCSSLTSVTIPDTVASIGDDAFGDCTSLASVTIGSSVTSLGAGAFYGCSSLTSVTIPDTVTNLGQEAFDYCSSLASVTIGSGVNSIEYDTFNYCSSLTNVTIGSSVTSLGDYAFYGCSSLTSVAIPASVTNIEDTAFGFCSSLITITADGGNADYSSVDGVLFDKNQATLVICPGGKVGSYTISKSVTSIGDEAFADCNSLTSVSIPGSVTNLGAGAFGGCSSLTSVTIPNSVTSLGEQAFDYCLGLTNVTIGSGVTTIRDQAFALCLSLTKVTIGRSVTSIEGYAFYNCPSLKRVYFQGNSPTPTNDLNVFYGDTPGTVYYLPSTTGWGALFDGWPTMTNAVSSTIGSVVKIVGKVTVKHMGGQSQPLNLNDPIQQGDVIETDKSGQVNIGFVNNTELNLSHNANITIDEYVYDPNDQTATFQIHHHQGSVWCRDGQIGNGCQILTGYGYTGIRGTEFIEQLDPCSLNEVVYLIEGELAITPQATGVTNIVDAPATIVFDASNFSTSALTQATYDALLAQVNQTNETFASWQVQYFDCTNNPDAAPNADPSGDGQDNFTKFLADMNPTNRASYFHILSATPEGNNLLVSWLCGGGRTNVLQTTTNLGGTWSDVSPNIVLAGSGDSTTNYLDVGAVTNTPARFYRVQLVQ